MALIAADIKYIVDIIKSFSRETRVLSLGHPDILATPDEVAPMINDKLLKVNNKTVRKERIGQSRKDCIGSAFELFRSLGSGLTVLGQYHLFGTTHVVDLNQILSFYDYDLVIDPGTTEHVFNIGRVLTSVLSAMSVDGYAYHVVPMTMVNHGYWNFSPAVFVDFYEKNGCRIDLLEGRRKNGTRFDVPYREKFKEPVGNSMLVCIAKKMRPITDGIVWPMQDKYK